ncbi:hypothetical protein STEG23_036476 [Scotinomys teguina]
MLIPTLEQFIYNSKCFFGEGEKMNSFSYTFGPNFQAISTWQFNLIFVSMISPIVLRTQTSQYLNELLWTWFNGYQLSNSDRISEGSLDSLQYSDITESANQDLQNRLLNLESSNLMQELQFINNKCIAKIGFVDNKYEYLMDRTLTLQSEVVTTQTLCKEERLSLTDKIRSLESFVSEEYKRWYDSLKNLESLAREEVHSLEQTLCACLQALEETLCKHDKEPNKQKGKTIKVVTSPNGSHPMAYPVIVHERPADDTHPEPYVTHTLQPISIRDFKNMKEAIVTYGIHSTYVKQMLNSWSTSNRIIPDDWHQLTSAVLEYSQQLQWKSWLREEVRNLEQQGKPNKKLKTYIEKISDLIHKGEEKLWIPTKLIKIRFEQEKPLDEEK